MPTYNDLVRRGEKVIKRQQDLTDKIQWKAFRAADVQWNRSRRLLRKAGIVIETVMHDTVASTIDSVVRQVKLTRGRRSVKKTPR